MGADKPHFVLDPDLDGRDPQGWREAQSIRPARTNLVRYALLARYAGTLGKFGRALPGGRKA
jgi:hypothetical protein